MQIALTIKNQNESNKAEKELERLHHCQRFCRRIYYNCKLANNCFSDWAPVPAGVPQGTKLGPWLSFLMLNDLQIPNFDNWIYVDDTTVSEVVQNNSNSSIQ